MRVAGSHHRRQAAYERRELKERPVLIRLFSMIQRERLPRSVHGRHDFPEQVEAEQHFNIVAVLQQV
jgi:hypothetical protein